MAAADLYEKDYYAWAKNTAEAIRAKAFNRIDTDALADEVADMARKEKRSLRSRVAQFHLTIVRTPQVNIQR